MVENEQRLEGFLKMISTYLENVVKDQKAAQKLIENDEAVKQYLRDNNWSKTDLTSQQFIECENHHMYGKITSNRLRDTKGVMIWPDGYMWIAYYDDDEKGYATAPRIFCDEDEFRMIE